jgi:GNAT superfamily N-acetyltransferase
MTSFSLRPAEEPDLPLLMAMIRELAEFEGLAQELEVTVDSLRAALFGPDAVARALVAWSEREPSGYAVFYRTFSTFVGRPGIFLDDLYVRPRFRKRGIGRALLIRVGQIATELGNGRFEWIALRWNENALGFYRGLGASEMIDWSLLRLNSDEVNSLLSSHEKRVV